MDRPVDDRLGGAPANVACGLARLGTPVAITCRLGQDAIGEAFSRLFAERGVNATLLQWDAERPSRIVLVRRSSDGERQFQGFAGDQGAGFADQALEPAALPQARWLLTGTLPLAAPASAAALLAAARQARSQGTALALDVNWRPTFWDATADPGSGPSVAAKRAIQPLLDQAALIKLAREEALWFFNSADPGTIQQALAQRPDVVVTDGHFLCAGNWVTNQASRLRFIPPPSLTQLVQVMPSRPVCCTGGQPLPGNESVLRPPVVHWSALVPVGLIPSRRRIRWRSSWGE